MRRFMQMPRLSRRRFIQSAGVLTASAAFPSVLFAKTATQGRLVVVILRGALDGLAAVPPHGDPDYARLHRDLAIAPPGAADGALGLDSTFGLHPALEFLHERYAGGELIVFQAAASPYRDRSHFDGQNVLENGFRQPLGSADGWLNRALASIAGARRGHRSERPADPAWRRTRAVEVADRRAGRGRGIAGAPCRTFTRRTTGSRRA